MQIIIRTTDDVSPAQKIDISEGDVFVSIGDVSNRYTFCFSVENLSSFLLDGLRKWDGKKIKETVK